MPFANLPAPLGAALSARDYATPTAVQAAILNPATSGRDLLVSAQTGSGKTVAFGLALASTLLDADGRAGAPGAPGALVIAPTRELALQVSRELAWLYADTGVRIASCVGGMDASRERRMLTQGAQIVVGTPGRLRDHLERGALDLSMLGAVVLDEADEMLDMGFREDLEEILDATPETRRTLMFSATLPKPIVALARRYQRDALRIAGTGEDRGHGDIEYQALAVAPPDIENATVNLLRLHEAETAMLFCATREAVRRLHAALLERGFAVVALSGEHSQSERNAALQALRDGRARVCVATDVAARGIDLPALSLVVHVELPRDAETLQHRSGRTGRAGRKGTAVLIVPYPRRRRVEAMLRDARVEARWIDVPTPEAIRAADRGRLLAALLAEAEYDAEDRALAALLLAQRGPEDIAAALVKAYRSALPAAEELIAPGDAASRREGGADAHRPGFDDTVWFRIDVGRRQNADPRWILPLLCRRGHITRSEVGAIRIGPNETRFDVPRAIAERFRSSWARTAGEDDGAGAVRLEMADGAPPPGRPPHGVVRERPRRGAPGEGAPGAPLSGSPHAPRSAPGGRPPRPGKPRPARKGAPR
ncbi:MAG: DEAD/DEAH box helicase [Sphingomonadaceae bacterium]|nr:DEAD/DEAH box helicase [Sphingomonadaceae bacterium]